MVMKSIEWEVIANRVCKFYVEIANRDKWFTVKHGIPGQSYYNYTDSNRVPDDIRFVGKDKYPKWFLVWQAVDEFGNISEHSIKDGTLGAEEYRSECHHKRLIPYINKNNFENPVLFWPDMATIHYARSVQNWFGDNNIEFIEEWKMLRTSLRPIEIFWNLCKQEYKMSSQPPKNFNGFKKVWYNISKSVAQSHAKRLMVNVRRRLRQIGESGPLIAFKHQNWVLI